ncbi:calcium/lipid-binding (CaLB) phosphatase [Tasmannia lanceolata]|uniref:calcium/lipid-binding (CaLB) phosphatase n=1 Tax=Tasmannia lanceolata TaxID=3420 RepID=UPI0040639BEF
MLVAGYDLDMSYITDHLLAMSFPAEHMRAMYRNPLWQVKDVLDMRHSGHYKVYNLCIEESYDPSHFHGRVEMFPFDDNHVPSLETIKLFCESVYSWLSVDPKNIAVIHCMAGKGRTGLMVCAYLVYTGMSADAALQLYADRRTTNNQGVSIPSQRRYVSYWSKILTFPRGVVDGPPNVILPQPSSRELRRIRLYDTVNIGSVFFVVSELQEVPGQLYRPPVEVARSCCRQIKQGYHRTNSPRYYLSFIENDGDEKKLETETARVVVQMDTESSIIYQKTCLDYYFDKPILVSGNVRVIFYEKMIGGRLFYACFNTAFITSSLLQFSLRDLDKVGRKGKSICGPSFCVELLFGPANVSNPIFPMEDSCDDSIALVEDSCDDSIALVEDSCEGC